MRVIASASSSKSSVSMLTSVVLSAALGLAVLQGAHAWGGLFNRFNPSMLSNLGYGSSYGSKLYNVQEKSHLPALMNEIEEEEVQEESDPCMGKQCTANEHCCVGHVCVDTEEDLDSPQYGSCMPIYGKKQGEGCFRDNDCESGFLCLKDGLNGEKSCQAPVPGTQGLGEDCRTSSDCDVNRELCCKLQRRMRAQPKKICAYFTDPQVCIGPVSANRLPSQMEHTAGEKRRSGHPDYHHLK